MSLGRALPGRTGGFAGCGRGRGAGIRVGGGRESSALAVAKPQLTSLVDALTILLVFLLKSFSAGGDLVTPSRDLVLPVSSSRERPLPTVSIEIAAGRISVDGSPLVEGEGILASEAGAAGRDSLMIPELEERLRAISRATRTAGEQHEVTIQCDRRVDFAVVKRIMYTCARAEYGDFSLLAFEEGS
jgi:biopolymer transport protein ExbD